MKLHSLHLYAAIFGWTRSRPAGIDGSVASAGDNAAMESWKALLQKNVLNRRRWATRDLLHDAIVFWIERTYNRRRRQRALGKLTPVEYELALHRPERRPCGMTTTKPVSTDPAAVPSCPAQHRSRL